MILVLLVVVVDKTSDFNIIGPSPTRAQRQEVEQADCTKLVRLDNRYTCRWKRSVGAALAKFRLSYLSALAI